MRLFVALVFSIALCSVFGDDCPEGLCDATETCCDGPSAGLYGCCPAPNAVCCSDGLHCCPENTVCNLSAGTCDDKQGVRLPFIHRKRVIDPPAQKPKAASLSLANKLEVIYCPGGVYYCQDGTTCCLLPTGQYGCCPYPNAVCCQDRVHCCPYGTHCDSTSQYCLQGSDRYAALFKRPAFPMN
ncbi:Granulins [Araneus ventricosus]|uniref:Granulins n=1 Tax=Araneus ventricosus TaxID=182803 RepID=A0A4Y2CZ83_ARAVE|nr:Granulins [Araneus ventricosus]